MKEGKLAHGLCTVAALAPRRAGIAGALTLAACLAASPASAYVGDSYILIPGVKGDGIGEQHKGWVRFNANYWGNEPTRFYVRRGTGGGSSGTVPMFYAAPVAPKQGAQRLMVSIDKHSALFGKLMSICASKQVMPEITYSESSERSRPSGEIGPRPADMPEFWRYKLSDVTISSCPVVNGAPDQAFVFSFKNIQWLNWDPKNNGKATEITPQPLLPAQRGGETKTYVISWFGYANDARDDQCEKVNEKPPLDFYYKYLTADVAKMERARLAPQGGAQYAGGEMCLRGPESLNACRLPGIVVDPGQFSPKESVTVVRGLNLDGDEIGRAKPGVSPHQNYVSPDGLRGVDNQLYKVFGCYAGWQGHKGQLLQYANESRRSGGLSIIVQITGIDNYQNDDMVDVTFFYSGDPVGKNSAGTDVLPDFTFRTHTSPQYTRGFRRWQAKIVNGEIVTPQIDVMPMNIPLGGIFDLRQAAMRLKMQPDGTLKGVLAGYQDWRNLVTMNANSQQESLYGGDVNAMYNAMKKAADGLWNPVTKQFDGVSTVFDVEGLPAFVAPEDQPALIAGNFGPAVSRQK